MVGRWSLLTIREWVGRLLAESCLSVGRLGVRAGLMESSRGPGLKPTIFCGGIQGPEGPCSLPKTAKWRGRSWSLTKATFYRRFSMTLWVFCTAGVALAQVVTVTTPAFPVTAVGSSVTLNATITVNTGGNSVVFNSIALAPGFNDFMLGTIAGCVVDGSTANIDGTVCTVPVTFAPKLPGNASTATPIARSAPLLVSDVENGTPAQYTYGLVGSGTTPLPVVVPGIISDIVGNDIGGLGGALPPATGFGGDGGPASGALVNNPFAIAVDAAGNLYISDTNNCVVRRVDKATQTINTVAGVGQSCGAGTDGVAATASLLSNPTGIALDAAGNLYIADSGNSAVRVVSAATGIITTVAGTLNVQGYGGDGGPANAVGTALLNNPGAITVDGYGNIVIADVGNRGVRRVQAATGNITTIAFTGPVAGVAVDSVGNVYLADESTNSILRVDAVTGAVSTYISLQNTLGTTPLSLAIDASDDLHFALAYGAYKVLPGGSAAILEAGGDGSLVGNFFGPGDGGAATLAALNLAVDVVADGAGNLYILEAEGVRYVDSTGTQATPVGFWQLTQPGVNPFNLLGVTTAAQDVLLFNGDIATPAGGTAHPLGVFYSGLNLPFSISAPTAGQDCSAASSTVSLPLSPAAFCTLAIVFTPTVLGGVSASTSLFETSSATPQTQTLSLIGVGGYPAVTMSPSQLTFLESAGVTSPAQTVTLRNNLPNAIAITSLGFTDNSAAASWWAQTNTCPAVLAGNTSCTFTVTYTPGAGGRTFNDLQVYYSLDPGQGSYAGGVQIETEGDGFNGGGNLSPNAVNFGPQFVGTTSAPVVVKLNSTGAPPTYTWGIGINSITITGPDAAQFLVSGTTCGLSVAVGASCAISVEFQPTAGSGTGGFNASLTVNYNSGSNGPLTIPLNGTSFIPFNINETIHVHDAEMFVPSTPFNINETIHVTDTIVTVPAGSSTTLISSASTVAAGGTVNLTATVASSLGAPSSGTVKFYQDGTLVNSATISNGVATYTTAALSAGSHALQADFVGTSVLLPSNSATVTVTATSLNILTVSSQAVSRSYGASNPTFVPTYTGWINGDGPAVLTGSPGLSSTAGYLSMPGQYAINVSVAGITGYPSYYYLAASPGVLTVTNGAVQTIAFALPNVPISMGLGPLTLTGMSTSGLPVSYTVTSGPATVAGSTLTLTGAGTVTVTATQAGNADYGAATAVAATITVTP
jgi:hypothetical protein